MRKYNEKELEIKLDFDQPEYISVEKHDLVTISFEKNNFWLRPVDEDKLAVPDDFKIEVLLSPQTKDAM